MGTQWTSWGEGRNPITILVRCCRVIDADGSLTGFADGLEREVFLLALGNPDRSASHACSDPSEEFVARHGPTMEVRVCRVVLKTTTRCPRRPRIWKCCCSRGCLC